jgi:hypothetical protein
MQTAAINNLVFTGCSSFELLADLPTVIKQGEFYQQITQELIKDIYTRQALNGLAQKLIALAHHSYTFRKMDALEQASQMLMRLPLSRHHQSVGWYYHSFNLRREGRVTEARAMLERVAEEVPSWYRGRIIMSLAGLVFDSGDFHSALPLYVEAGRAASHSHWQDWFVTAHTQKMIAVLKSIDGDDRGALADLERLFPLIRAVGSSHPHLYYDYMNSLAVELCGVGRLEEARNTSRIVLASPYANAYPEWRETREEIELRGWRTSRSVVAFGERATHTENLLRLPAPDMVNSASPAKSIPRHTNQRARVFDLLEWKKKMGKEPNNTPDEKSYKDMDAAEILLRIMELTGTRDRTYDELLRILKAIDKVLSEPKESA